MTKKVLLILTIIILLGLTTKCTKNVPKQKDKIAALKEKDSVITIQENKKSILREAHRGYSLHFPENTLPAFEEAIKMGVDRIELDVNITSDGELIIFHDKILGRTTDGNGFVTETSYAEIRKLDAGSWKSPEFKGIKVPTLKEVFELTKGKCMLNLDLKDEKVAIPMAKLAKEMGMINDIVITGTIPQSVKAIRSVDQSITMFYELEKEKVLNYPVEQVIAIRKAHLSGCLLDFTGINEVFMKECKKHGIAVYVYGVLLEKDMRRLINLGVDGIMTDDLELLNKVLDF